MRGRTIYEVPKALPVCSVKSMNRCARQVSASALRLASSAPIRPVRFRGSRTIAWRSWIGRQQQGILYGTLLRLVHEKDHGNGRWILAVQCHARQGLAGHESLKLSTSLWEQLRDLGNRQMSAEAAQQGQLLIERISAAEPVEGGQQKGGLLVAHIPDHSVGGLAPEFLEGVTPMTAVDDLKEPGSVRMRPNHQRLVAPVRSMLRTSLAKFARLIQLGLSGCGNSFSSGMC